MEKNLFSIHEHKGWRRHRVSHVSRPACPQQAQHPRGLAPPQSYMNME